MPSQAVPSESDGHALSLSAPLDASATDLRYNDTHHIVLPDVAVEVVSHRHLKASILVGVTRLNPSRQHSELGKHLAPDRPCCGGGVT